MVIWRKIGRVMIVTLGNFIISCCSKIQDGFDILVLDHPSCLESGHENEFCITIDTNLASLRSADVYSSGLS